MDKVLINAFYRFQKVELSCLSTARERILQAGRERGIRGLLLLAEEGVNATVCGEPGSLRAFVEYVASQLNHSGYETKESWSPTFPFKRLQVQIRPEIVTLDESVFEPDEIDVKSHLSPSEWNEWLRQGALRQREFTLVDTRNWYETKLGLFNGARDPHINNFGEFPRYLEAAGIPKDKPLLMYCTGGIRCEKAAPLLRKAGFKEVYQLDGGILNYLAEYPNAEFKGECYVFDHRVAVDQELKPSERYRLCPHCGNPAERSLACGRCHNEARICDDCAKVVERQTCSKNCAYHERLRLNPALRQRQKITRLPAEGDDVSHA